MRRARLRARRRRGRSGGRRVCGGPAGAGGTREKRPAGAVKREKRKVTRSGGRAFGRARDERRATSGEMRCARCAGGTWKGENMGIRQGTGTQVVPRKGGTGERCNGPGRGPRGLASHGGTGCNPAPVACARCASGTRPGRAGREGMVQGGPGGLGLHRGRDGQGKAPGGDGGFAPGAAGEGGGRGRGEGRGRGPRTLGGGAWWRASDERRVTRDEMRCARWRGRDGGGNGARLEAAPPEVAREWCRGWGGGGGGAGG